MTSPHHILFAGGGSLGNIYPGMAVAERLLKRLPGMRLTFAGDGRPIERHTVRAAGHAYLPIPGRRRPQRLLDSIRFVTDNAAGYCAARWVLKEQGVSLVVGMGGHASAAVLRAAHDIRLPIVLLEPNVVPSFSTAWMANRAEAICLAYDESRPHLPVDSPILVTGVPGRPIADRPYLRVATTESPRRLVVLGGEGGASSLNESMPVALSRTGLTGAGWSVVHQTGEGQLLETIERYRRADVDAVVVTYVDQLTDLLRETDLVVCRSSGCTLSELARASAPALLVPDTRTPNSSQAANAQLALRGGACRVIDERRGDLVEVLARELATLSDDEAQRQRMAAATATAYRPEAAERIAEVCVEAVGAAQNPQIRARAA